MNPQPAIDITPEDLKTVLSIKAQLIPTYKIGVFGSRVTGKARKFSDLDLVIFTEIPLDFDTYAALKEAFSASDLPFKVDVVDWAAIDDEFKKIIAQQMVMLS